MFRKSIIAVVSAFIMASVFGQVPISNLPNATLPLGNTDQLVVNQLVSPNVYSTRKAPINALNPFFPPITSHYLLQAPDPLLTQSRVLAGTANQIILTDGGALGNLTLSLPQSICLTCSPTFAGLTLTNPLLATSGGTGFNTYAVGDLLTASTTTALSKLSDVAAGSYLRSGGVSTVPLWSTLTLPNAATTGDIFIATGTNVMGRLADVTAGSYLRSAGAGVAPIYSTTTIPNTAILGDLWYGSAGNVISALAGNTTTTKQFLTQTGSGAVSAAPVWGTIQASDIPTALFANPTGTIGLTAVNGVATTAPRSDSAPALSQAISPTWTGTHLFRGGLSRGGTTSQITAGVTGTIPIVGLTNSGAGTDQKSVELVMPNNNGDFTIQNVNQAGNTTSPILSEVRGTGVAVGSITLGNNTDNPIVTIGGGQMSITGKNGTGVTCNSSTGTNGTALCVSNNTTGGHTMWSEVISPVGGAGNELGLLIDGGTTSNATDVLFRVDGGNFSQVFTVNGLGASTFNGASVTSNVGIVAQTSRQNPVATTSSVIIGATSGSTAQAWFIDSATAVDNRMWDINTNGTTFGMRAVNDANNSASTWVQVTRSGVTISDITLATGGTAHLTGIGTTASAANMFIDNASGNNILRSTSSRRYKTDISTLADATDVVMKLRPVRFHSKATADSHTAWFYGLVAEEVATVEPSLIVRDPQGRPDGVQYDRVQVFMLPMVQSMHRQIQMLWGCILILAIWNVYLTMRKRR